MPILVLPHRLFLKHLQQPWSPSRCICKNLWQEEQPVIESKSQPVCLWEPWLCLSLTKRIQLVCCLIYAQMLLKNSKNFHVRVHLCLRSQWVLLTWNPTIEEYHCFDSFRPTSFHYYNPKNQPKSSARRFFSPTPLSFSHPILEWSNPIPHWKRCSCPLSST